VREDIERVIVRDEEIQIREMDYGISNSTRDCSHSEAELIVHHKEEKVM
jgi:hypothetical protein